MQDGCKLSHLTTVSREWQTDLERHNFARIKLTPSRIIDFSPMVHRNRALVRYIWFCLEHEDYDCTTCAPCHPTLTDDELDEALTISDRDHCPITSSFQNLFLILSTWEPKGDLILDISIFSPSDSGTLVQISNLHTRSAFGAYARKGWYGTVDTKRNLS